MDEIKDESTPEQPWAWRLAYAIVIFIDDSPALGGGGQRQDQPGSPAAGADQEVPCAL